MQSRQQTGAENQTPRCASLSGWGRAGHAATCAAAKAACPAAYRKGPREPPAVNMATVDSRPGTASLPVRPVTARTWDALLTEDASKQGGGSMLWVEGAVAAQKHN